MRVATMTDVQLHVRELRDDAERSRQAREAHPAHPGHNELAELVGSMVASLRSAFAPAPAATGCID